MVRRKKNRAGQKVESERKETVRKALKREKATTTSARDNLSPTKKVFVFKTLSKTLKSFLYHGSGSENSDDKKE